MIEFLHGAYFYVASLSLLSMLVIFFGTLLVSAWLSMKNAILRTLPKSALVIMLVSFFCATMQAQKSATVYVDQYAKEKGDGTLECPYQGIQEAIDACAGGTNKYIILVAPGTYEAVSIDGQSVDIIASTNQGAYVIDGGGVEWAVAARNLPKGFRPKLQDFEIRNSTNGVMGCSLVDCAVDGYEFVGVSNCIVRSSVIEGGAFCAVLSSLSDSIIRICSDTGALSSSLSNVEIGDCRIGAIGCALTNCNLYGSTCLGAMDSFVTSSYVTNNQCCAISNCTVDTCLIADNDQGMIDGVATCSTITANRFCGVSGTVTAYNTILAYNKDGEGHYLNYSGDKICMTNCCSSPIPNAGTNNVLCGVPIHPRTFRPRLYSPVIGAGCTNFVFTSRDLAGRNRIYSGVTDMGAFRATTTTVTDCTRETPIPVPYKWLKDKLVASYNDVKGKGIITAWEDNGSYVRFNYNRYYDGILHIQLYANIKCETMANYASGKKLPDGSAMTWWMEYLCGTDPNKSKDYFTANITVTNDVPYVTWSPNLGSERLYLIEGTRDLKEEWELVDDIKTTDCKLFRISVELP